MKLISKTILYYLLISLPLVMLAGFFSYNIIRYELREGTDESLIREMEQAERLIKTFKVPHNIMLSTDSLSDIAVINNYHADKFFFTETRMFDKAEEEYVTYRVLKCYTNINNTTYLITILKTTLEEDELLEGLFSGLGLMIGFLVFAFFIVNWLLAKLLWKPFYVTLDHLNTYEIAHHKPHAFSAAKTKEFDQLNKSLNKMTQKAFNDFKQQKEFTENASHEMQTPLAIVQANLELLMQSSHLKEEEMNQLQAIENTIKKLGSLNKALLLLSKIDNNQFKESEKINLVDVINKALNNYQDLIQAKNITLDVYFNNDLFLVVNPALAYILITNLLQNAIRHNHEGGKISINLMIDTLTISNSGEALTINENDLFVRFKKNDSSKESLGLGLSIVKSITALYNFKIEYKYIHHLHTFIVKF